MIRERFYFTMNELIEGETLIQDFQSFFAIFNISFVEGTNTKFLYDSLLTKYGDDNILYVDIAHPDWEMIEEPTKEELQTIYIKQVRKQLNKIKEWLDSSQFRYDVLIENYENYKNKLMNPIKSSSSSQFNDTPQTTIDGLDGDGYATTYTKGESATEGASNIERLNNIRLYWNSIFDEWQNEFAKLFVMY